MEEESTLLANIMIQIGISEGEKRSQSKMDRLIDEALKANPTISLAEFKKQFLKNHNED